MNDFNAPTVEVDVPDAAYLTNVLDRAGRTFPVAGEIQREPLDGGRTGVGVSRLQDAVGTSFVIKQIPRGRAFREALGHEGEGLAWLRDLTRDLPSPLDNPTLDVALNTERDEWWLLMEDVSAGIVGRAQWSENHTYRLFEGLAALHARHWERLDPADHTDTALGTVFSTTGVLAEPVVHVATGEPAPSPWVARVADEFPVPRMFLPTFLDALGARDGDFYVELCRNWRRIAAGLERHPATLLHGDTRRANVAFLDDGIHLFDWELAARGPAAMDLTWHWFLHYWAYPPDDGRSPDQRLWLRDAYLDRLEQCLDRPIDRDAFRVTWDLGWLRVFAQLGYCLADPLTGDDTSPEAIDRATRCCHEAIAEARRIADAHVH